MKRKKYIVNGRVQGVGFRPFVYRLAARFSLKGYVSNNEQGVVIDVEGHQHDLECFSRALEQEQPPLARITRIKVHELKSLAHPAEFVITPSTSGEKHNVLISPDAAVCRDCKKEVLDPQNRRYLYPFTNCTNCGPRLTITRSIPYDRPMTSMACFDMCPDCLKEYNAPLDRRFHAQPNACHVCGPQAWLTDHSGEQLAREAQALVKSAQLLLQGRILAVKGLGGFHLVCDAGSSKSVQELRKRKHRPDKSLAVMVPDMETAAKVARVSPEHETLLSSVASPIVILPVNRPFALSSHLSPDTDNLGIMLPYTPLHLVLFKHLKDILPSDRLPALVMTSGNFSKEPISLGNREALERLGAIADYFLLHNRDILTRCDDSVMFAADPKPVFLRRARGYTPVPVFLNGKGPSVLGTGPELKNTICITKDDQAYISQHMGDLKNLETFDFFIETINHFKDILRVEPQAVVHDYHPDYLSTRYALEDSGLPAFALQHHFAHTFSVMAENNFQGKCLGLALDGTGLGLDNTLWGGELLLVDNTDLTMQRIGSFAPVPLPGGEKAIEEPWRITLGYLHTLGIRQENAFLWPEDIAGQHNIVMQMLDRKINSPLSSGCGRLFDAVAALLGLVCTIRYEGQGAVRLETIQDHTHNTFHETGFYEQDGLLILDTISLFEKIVKDKIKQIEPEIISRRFHLSLAHGICKWVARASRETGVRHIGLSGGVMQNMTLFSLMQNLLKEEKLKVMVHNKLPPGDACVSLGQAVFGRQMLILSR